MRGKKKVIIIGLVILLSSIAALGSATAASKNKVHSAPGLIDELVLIAPDKVTEESHFPIMVTYANGIPVPYAHLEFEIKGYWGICLITDKNGMANGWAPSVPKNMMGELRARKGDLSANKNILVENDVDLASLTK